MDSSSHLHMPGARKGEGWLWPAVVSIILLWSGAASADYAVGSMAGDFSVSADGAANYQLPIDVPPGTAGMQPELAVLYNSRAGNGLIGRGFSLSGMSMISRCAASEAQGDSLPGGAVTDAVDFDSHDRLCLDGQLLKRTQSGTYGDNGVYHTEIESFQKVEAFGATNYELAWGNHKAATFFTVKDSAGLCRVYGKHGAVSGSNFCSFTNATDSEDDGLISATLPTPRYYDNTVPGPLFIDVPLSWMVSRIYDRFGNYISYHYGRNDGEFWPEEIAYYNNQGVKVGSVRFDYRDDRKDKRMGYMMGHKAQVTRLLKRINVFDRNNRPVRNYQFSYRFDTTNTDNANNFVNNITHLESIKHCAGSSNNNCLPPTEFTWLEGPREYESSASTFLFAETPLEDSKFINLDGDAVPDIIYPSDIDSNDLGVTGCKWMYRLGADPITGDPSTATDSGISCVGYQVGAEHADVIDLNGDGRDDILMARASKLWIMTAKNTGSGFNTPVNLGFPDNNAYHDRNMVFDINKDGYPDYLFRKSSSSSPSGKTIHYYLHNGLSGDDATLISETDTEIPIWDHSGLSAISYDNDGHPNLVISASNGNPNQGDGSPTDEFYTSLPYAGVFDWDGSALFKMTGNDVGGLQPTNAWNRMRKKITLDINGDGLTDQMYVSEVGADQRFKVQFNTGNGLYSHAALELEELPDHPHFGPLDAGDSNLDELEFGVPFDYNRDGMDDLLLSNPRNVAGCGAYFRVLISNGETMSHACTNLDNSYRNNLRPFDRNGDGIVEFGFTQEGNGITLRTQSAVTAQNGLLHKIEKKVGRNGDLGEGDLTTIAYGTTSEPFFRGWLYAGHDCETGQPCASLEGERVGTEYQNYSGPITVVRAFQRSSGIEDIPVFTNYLYQGAKAHTRGRGLLGFSQMTAHNYNTNTVTINRYRQDFPFTGQLTSTETWIARDGAATFVDIADNHHLSPSIPLDPASLCLEEENFNCDNLPPLTLIDDDPSGLLTFTATPEDIVERSETDGWREPATIQRGSAELYFPRARFSTITNYQLGATTPTVLSTSKVTTKWDCDDEPTNCWGHVTQTKTKTESANTSDGYSKWQELITNNEYYSPSHAGSDHCLGRVAATQARHRAIDFDYTTREITRLSGFDYDFGSNASCQLTVEKLEPANAGTFVNSDGNIFEVVKRNSFDSFGNITRVETSSSNTGNSHPVYGLAESRISTTGYDSYGQFAISNTDVYGHTSYLTYDPRFGVATQATGHNNLTSSTTIDDFGRTVTTTSPRTDLYTDTERRWCDAQCVSDEAIFEIQTSVSSGGTTFTEYDRIGREVAMRSQNLHGAFVITEKSYDPKGRNYASTAPYLESETPCWSFTKFDRYGRITDSYTPKDETSCEDSSSNPLPYDHSGSVPWGNHTQYAYGYDAGLMGLVFTDFSPDASITKTIDTLGRPAWTVKNILGQTEATIERVEDEDGDEIQTGVLFAMDAQGNTTKIRRFNGNGFVDAEEINITYGKTGNKRQMNDPNLGEWRYRYNVLGELRWQKDAKDQITRLDYDRLGRMIKRRAFAENGGPLVEKTEWIYDNDGSGIGASIGKLVAVYGPGDYHEFHAYNNYGEHIAKLTALEPDGVDAIDDESELYLTETTYDMYGRVENTRYPAIDGMMPSSIDDVDTGNAEPPTGNDVAQIEAPTPGTEITSAQYDVLWTARPNISYQILRTKLALDGNPEGNEELLYQGIGLGVGNPRTATVDSGPNGDYRLKIRSCRQSACTDSNTVDISVAQPPVAVNSIELQIFTTESGAPVASIAWSSVQQASSTDAVYKVFMAAKPYNNTSDSDAYFGTPLSYLPVTQGATVDGNFYQVTEVQNIPVEVDGEYAVRVQACDPNNLTLCSDTTQSNVTSFTIVPQAVQWSGDNESISDDGVYNLEWQELSVNNPAGERPITKYIVTEIASNATLPSDYCVPGDPADCFPIPGTGVRTVFSGACNGSADNSCSSGLIDNSDTENDTLTMSYNLVACKDNDVCGPAAIHNVAIGLVPETPTFATWTGTANGPGPSDVTSCTIDLSWNQASLPGATYKVQEYNGNSPADPPNTISTSQTEMSLTREPFALHYYRVQACPGSSSSNCSDESAPVYMYVTPSFCETGLGTSPDQVTYLPHAPSSFEISRNGSGKYNLAFDLLVDAERPVTHINLYESGSSDLIASLGCPFSSCNTSGPVEFADLTINNMPRGRLDLVIRAKNQAGESDPSNSHQLTVIDEPTGLNLSNVLWQGVGNGGIDIVQDDDGAYQLHFDPVEGAAGGYIVQERRQPSTPYSNLSLSTSCNSNSCTSEGINNRPTGIYTYRVIACASTNFSDDCGDPSAETVQIEVVREPEAPTNPRLLQDGTASDTFTIEWNQPTPANDSTYEVQSKPWEETIIEVGRYWEGLPNGGVWDEEVQPDDFYSIRIECASSSNDCLGEQSITITEPSELRPGSYYIFRIYNRQRFDTHDPLIDGTHLANYSDKVELKNGANWQWLLYAPAPEPVAYIDASKNGSNVKVRWGGIVGNDTADINRIEVWADNRLFHTTRADTPDTINDFQGGEHQRSITSFFTTPGTYTFSVKSCSTSSDDCTTRDTPATIADCDIDNLVSPQCDGFNNNLYYPDALEVTIEASDLPPVVPNQPVSGVTISPANLVAGNSIEVEWDNPAYVYQSTTFPNRMGIYKKDPDTGQGVNVGTVNVQGANVPSSATVTITDAGTYEIGVTPCNLAGCLQNVIYSPNELNVIDKPTNLGFTNVTWQGTHGGIEWAAARLSNYNLTFNIAGVAAGGYVVQELARKRLNGDIMRNWTTLGSSPSCNSNSCTFSNLNNRPTGFYEYKVKACAGPGQSNCTGFSETKTIEVVRDPTPPANPQLQQLPYSDTLNLTWDQPTPDHSSTYNTQITPWGHVRIEYASVFNSPPDNDFEWTDDLEFHTISYSCDSTLPSCRGTQNYSQINPPDMRPGQYYIFRIYNHQRFSINGVYDGAPYTNYSHIRELKNSDGSWQWMRYSVPAEPVAYIDASKNGSNVKVRWGGIVGNDTADINRIEVWADNRLFHTTRADTPDTINDFQGGEHQRSITSFFTTPGTYTFSVKSCSTSSDDCTTRDTPATIADCDIDNLVSPQCDGFNNNLYYPDALEVTIEAGDLPATRPTLPVSNVNLSPTNIAPGGTTRVTWTNPSYNSQSVSFPDRMQIYANNVYKETVAVQGTIVPLSVDLSFTTVGNYTIAVTPCNAAGCLTPTTASSQSLIVENTNITPVRPTGMTNFGTLDGNIEMTWAFNLVANATHYQGSWNGNSWQADLEANTSNNTFRSRTPNGFGCVNDLNPKTFYLRACNGSLCGPAATDAVNIRGSNPICE